MPKSVLGEAIRDGRLAESDLPHGDLQFRHLLDKLPVAAYTCDAHGIITYFNEQAVRLWGRRPSVGDPRERYCGSWRMYLPDGTFVPHDQCWTAVGLRENREFDGEEVVIEREDGLRLTLLAHVNPIRSDAGDVIGAVNLLVDITERKSGEQAVQRSQRVLQDFFENAALGMHWIDADGVILNANQTELDMLGYRRDEYIGRRYADFHLDRELAEECMRRLVAGDTLRNWEARLRCRDGSVKYVAISSNVLWEDGRFIHSRGFTRDITEQKKAESALRDSHRRKDEFLATLAHELRNPLAPIRNSLQVLRMVNDATPAVERVYDMMERQVHHLIHLVDDLLEVSRVTRGKIELRKNRVELADVVRGAVETSLPGIEAAAHDLTVSLPDEPLVVMADPVRLSQVFSNLLNNAAKYSNDHGRIWLTVRREDGEVVVTVRDLGIGMPAEMLPQVFEMFAQVDSSVSHAQGGLGIGLTLVRSLVQLHGGSVEAYSDGPGKGSRFTVRLPLLVDQAAETAASPRPNGQRPAVPPRRVVVADDNRDAADSLGMLLRFLGADVHITYDGPSALAAVRSCRPAIALLDIGMPGMDGYDVARQLRSDPALADIRLIALTGWGQENDRSRSRAAGYDHHLVKPVSVEALEALLMSADGRTEATDLPS